MTEETDQKWQEDFNKRVKEEDEAHKVRHKMSFGQWRQNFLKEMKKKKIDDTILMECTIQAAKYLKLQ
jgi:hypothetical protein